MTTHLVRTRPVFMHSLLTMVLAIVAWLSPDVAWAQSAPAPAVTPEACVSAYNSSQELKLDQKITKAREQAAFCAQEACPAAVRSGCTKWLTELMASQPSIVISAKGPDGNDVIDVAVEIDGTKIADSLTGHPVELDPGKHTLKLTHEDYVSTSDILVTAGVKNRQVVVKFEDPTQKPVGSAPGDLPGSKAERGPPIGAFVIGGFGVAAFVVFGALAAVGSAEVDDLREGCGATSSCTDQEVKDAKTKLIVGDVFLASGSVALGVSLIWIIVHYSSDPQDEAPPPSAGTISWSVGPTPWGAFGSLGVAFE